MVTTGLHLVASSSFAQNRLRLHSKPLNGPRRHLTTGRKHGISLVEIAAQRIHSNVLFLGILFPGMMLSSLSIVSVN